MTVKVDFIQGSTSFFNKDTPITTLVCEYPRAIHAQLLTHRVFSKNSSSTRAVPIKKAIKNVKANPAKYIWTENQSGMQGAVITDPDKLFKINSAYEMAMLAACSFTEILGLPEDEQGLNVHKQNAGRLIEPYQNIRICLTSTEWDNWDWLRNDADAQGEIKELAQAIHQAKIDNAHKYLVLGADEWHLPFINRTSNPKTLDIEYFHPLTSKQLTLEQAKNLSMSLCAQISFRNADYSDEKTNTVIQRLFTGNKIHASPSEHQAAPINHPSFTNSEYWPEGVTHIDRIGNYWSGNFKHWIQLRQLLPNHDYAKRT